MMLDLIWSRRLKVVSTFLTVLSILRPGAKLKMYDDDWLLVGTGVVGLGLALAFPYSDIDFMVEWENNAGK